MAIYHLSAKTGSRKGGQSASAKSDYIRREGAYQRDAAELVHTCSANMPAWSADDPSTYWRAADEHERANGRLFKELDFALPRELDRSAQVDLAERFADHLAGDESLPYTLAIHRGRGSNPHVHLMISERINDGVERSPETWFKRWNGPTSGGAKKSSALKPKEWLEETRAAWSEYANAALDEVGSRERIDHRSLFDQGEAELEPQIHLGPKAAHALREGIDTKRTALWETIEDSNTRIVFDRRNEAERRESEQRATAAVARAEAAREADALAARQGRETEWLEQERQAAAEQARWEAEAQAEANREAAAAAANQVETQSQAEGIAADRDAVTRKPIEVMETEMGYRSAVRELELSTNSDTLRSAARAADRVADAWLPREPRPSVPKRRDLEHDERLDTPVTLKRSDGSTHRVTLAERNGELADARERKESALKRWKSTDRAWRLFNPFTWRNEIKARRELDRRERALDVAQRRVKAVETALDGGDARERIASAVNNAIEDAEQRQQQYDEHVSAFADEVNGWRDTADKHHQDADDMERVSQPKPAPESGPRTKPKSGPTFGV